MEFERVQAIASLSKNTDTIPPEFIRSKNEQPASTTLHGVSLEVPVINIGENDEDKIIDSIREASKEWGLFQVVNHGISDHFISELQRVGREFFDLPEEEKESIAKTPESGVQGYGTKLQKEVEGRKGWVDHLFHKVWPPSAVNYRFWPQSPPSYRLLMINNHEISCKGVRNLFAVFFHARRKANEEYAIKIKEVSDKLLRWLSLGLGLEEEELKVAIGGEDIVFLLKINFYPPCPRPDLALGVTAHTDMCALTVLVPNDVQGLQVCRNGHWYDVKYIPNALIIHIGDQMEILSNGTYKAVLHRSTVNKDKARMSWPVFLEPPQEHVIGPIPKLVSEQSPSKFKAKMYKDYAYCKLNKLPQ